MQKNDFSKTLEQFRAQIDAVDSDILCLLAERFKVVEQVGALKTKHGLTGSYIRPAREANMLRALLEKAEGQGVPQSLVAAIWRLIIGSSTAHESPLNVVYLSNDLRASFAATQYFSDAVSQFGANKHDFWNGQNVNAHSIFVLPNDLTHPLWFEMPAHLKVFACLPFSINCLSINVFSSNGSTFSDGTTPPPLAGGGWGEGSNLREGNNPTPTHLAIANITPEATGNDVSLFHDGTKIFEINSFTQQLENSTYIGSYAKPYII